MGEYHEHRCSHCGYKANVSGGDDSGFISRTTTIMCIDCKELSDAVMVDLDRKRQKIQCKQSVKHQWVRWKSGGPCPRCGNPIQQGRLLILWD